MNPPVTAQITHPNPNATASRMSDGIATIAGTFDNVFRSVIPANAPRAAREQSYKEEQSEKGFHRDSGRRRPPSFHDSFDDFLMPGLDPFTAHIRVESAGGLFEAQNSLCGGQRIDHPCRRVLRQRAHQP